MGNFFLALDASGETASAAIICNGIALATKTQNASEFDYFRSTELLLPLVHELRSEASRLLDLNEGDFAQKLQGILVGTGPGSFTGVRSAISTAIGLSIGWRAELVGMSILHAMAYSYVRNFVQTIVDHSGKAPDDANPDEINPDKPSDTALTDSILRLLRDGKCDRSIVIAPLRNANANEFFTELYELQPCSKKHDDSRLLQFDLVSISTCFTVNKSDIEGEIWLAINTTSNIGEHTSVASSQPLIAQVQHTETNLAFLIGTSYAHMKMSQNNEMFSVAPELSINGNAHPQSYAIEPIYGKKVCALTIAERKQLRNQ